MDEMINPSSIKPKSSTEEFELPFDVVELPSKGKLYKGTSLEGREFLEVHYLTAQQEDILTSPNLIQSGKMIDALLESCIKDKSIDPKELILGDRNTIIVWLRSTGYGEEYPVNIGCQSCGTNYDNEFNLSDLDIRSLEVDPDENGLFSFDLPKSKKRIKFKFIDGQMESDIAKTIEARRIKMGSKVDNTLSMKMFYAIQEIDGNKDKSYIKKFVDVMPVADARAFRDYSNSIEPGIIMEQMCTCVNCGRSTMEVVPIRTNFFWPDSRS